MGGWDCWVFLCSFYDKHLHSLLLCTLWDFPDNEVCDKHAGIAEFIFLQSALNIYRAEKWGNLQQYGCSGIVFECEKNYICSSIVKGIEFCDMQYIKIKVLLLLTILCSKNIFLYINQSMPKYLKEHGLRLIHFWVRLYQFFCFTFPMFCTRHIIHNMSTIQRL